MRGHPQTVPIRTSGFTLVEALVALFVSSLVALMAAAVVTSTTGNQERVRLRTARLSEFERARALMRTDLMQSTPRPTRDVQGRPARTPFVGGDPFGENPSLIVFVRQGYANPDGEARASVQYVEYRLVDGRLLRLTRPMPDGSALGPPQVLLAGVRSARIWFQSPSGGWSELWRGGADGPMPAAVRLDLDAEAIGPVSLLFITGAGGA
jgi:general secretion pathway protein J